mmetsp:Transcript_131455/g.227665  ORF Transcript_131455/g.227665 Transcript_131455/m.227665 type:complete len:200 (+) Transcript_131455:946-1545(+)
MVCTRRKVCWLFHFHSLRAPASSSSFSGPSRSSSAGAGGSGSGSRRFEGTSQPTPPSVLCPLLVRFAGTGGAPSAGWALSRGRLAGVSSSSGGLAAGPSACSSACPSRATSARTRLSDCVSVDCWGVPFLGARAPFLLGASPFVPGSPEVFSLFPSLSVAGPFPPGACFGARFPLPPAPGSALAARPAKRYRDLPLSKA